MFSIWVFFTPAHLEPPRLMKETYLVFSFAKCLIFHVWTFVSFLFSERLTIEITRRIANSYNKRTVMILYRFISVCVCVREREREREGEEGGEKG